MLAHLLSGRAWGWQRRLWWCSLVAPPTGERYSLGGKFEAERHVLHGVEAGFDSLCHRGSPFNPSGCDVAAGGSG